MGYTSATTAVPGSHSVSCPVSGQGNVPVDSPIVVYDATPTISSLSASSALRATAVTVNFSGVGFGASPPVLSFVPVPQPAPTVSISNATATSFTAQFTVATPGNYSLTVTSAGNGTGGFSSDGSAGDSSVSTAQTFVVYDATPVITLVNPLGELQPRGSIYIEVYGSNFGASKGSIVVCGSSATTCTQSPDITAVTAGNITFWGHVGPAGGGYDQIDFLMTEHFPILG
jgi:hypothetical protein